MSYFDGIYAINPIRLITSHFLFTMFLMGTIFYCMSKAALQIYLGSFSIIHFMVFFAVEPSTKHSFVVYVVHGSPQKPIFFYNEETPQIAQGCHV